MVFARRYLVFLSLRRLLSLVTNEQFSQAMTGRVLRYMEMNDAVSHALDHFLSDY